MCENYLLLNQRDDIVRILKNSEKDKYFSVNINFLELFDSDTNLGNALLTDPEVSLKNWNEAILHVQSDLLKESNEYTLKNNVNCRIYSLPPWPHVSRTIFPGNDDANKFLQITGTVVRISGRKLLQYQRQYVCVKCKYPMIVEAKYDKRNIIKQPTKCLNPEGCNGKNIVTFGELDTYNCKDYQEIKIQEDLSTLGMGTVPNHMIVTLEDDLVNLCKPGENVTITGIVTRRWSEFDKGVKIIVDIVLKANHIQVNNSSGLSLAVSDEMKQFFEHFWERHLHEPLVGRNIILRSISPEIYGLHLVKLAIAIVLAGGSQSQENETCTGIDTRSESHLLLVGDPGTGKSQMLRFASKIIPRSVLTTGVGSTAAGLTVSAVMENGEWQLEAGALVMADGGICCIDEFNSMREHDRTSIHEAMEQQTISVAKAGMVCKLKTRCSILAACNPKGNINLLQPLCVNVAMSSPLLSRFDLMMLLRDMVNEDSDRLLAEYLLDKGGQLSGQGMVWSLEKLQAYYAVIKKRNPRLTDDAESILSTYYRLQRKFAGRNKSRTTVRLLESLIRLSQGHAKLMYHSEVQVVDAIFAVTLTDAAMDLESSLLNLKVDNNSFFDEPERLYWDLLETVLGKLNLDHIYQKEIEKVGVESEINAQKHRTSISSEVDESITRLGTISQRPEDYARGAGLFSQNSVSSVAKRHQGLFSQRSKPRGQANSESDSKSASKAAEKSSPEKLANPNGVLNVSNASETLVSSQNKVERVPEKLLNESKDSGNFSHFTSLNSQITMGDSIEDVHTTLRKSIVIHKKNKLKENGVSNDCENYLERPSTSKNTEWSKKIMNSQRGFENVQKPLTLSQRVRNNNEINLNLDFDLCNDSDSCRVSKRSSRKLNEKGPEESGFSSQSMSDAIGSECITQNSSTSNVNGLFSQNTVSSIAKRPRGLFSQRRSSYISQASCEIQGGAAVAGFENHNNRALDIRNIPAGTVVNDCAPSRSALNKNDDPESLFPTNDDQLGKSISANEDVQETTGKKSTERKKRRSNSPVRKNKKSKPTDKHNMIENEMDLLKLMPSVNDDFANFEKDIDWGLESEESSAKNSGESSGQLLEQNGSTMTDKEGASVTVEKKISCHNIDLDIDEFEFGSSFNPFLKKAESITSGVRGVSEKKIDNSAKKPIFENIDLDIEGFEFSTNVNPFNKKI